MNYDSIEADQQAMRVIELLIESGHYKGFHKDEVIKTIARDANSLAAAFALKPEQAAEPVEAVEAQPDSQCEVAFPQSWTKATVEGNALPR